MVRQRQEQALHAVQAENQQERNKKDKVDNQGIDRRVKFVLVYAAKNYPVGIPYPVAHLQGAAFTEYARQGVVAGFGNNGKGLIEFLLAK